MADFFMTGNIVDIEARRIYKGGITVKDGRVRSVEEVAEADDRYIMPGFVDAHVHIESSMLVPSEFARIAVAHGTVATVSDPHEIANVLGVAGVEYMIRNGSRAPFKFCFGAPSCVPATGFETAGAEIDVAETEYLLSKPEIKYLSEMMNWPGVMNDDPVVLEKIAIARKLGKPVDGHAPGLKGDLARCYAAAGISTDHECVAMDEALDKIAAGMKILIREGSAARNFDALIDLLPEHDDIVMFCSDDKHPDSLVEGHINLLVKKAVGRGIDLFSVLKAACVNPVAHYGLDVGLLRPGDPADFIVVDDLESFKVRKTFVNGELVAENGQTRIGRTPVRIVNNFKASPKNPEDFAYRPVNSSVRVIKALDGRIITDSFSLSIDPESRRHFPDVENDLLLIAVVNRYADTKPALGLISGFGLNRGAIASSVAHDSHNIVVVGTNEKDICGAVNEVIRHHGGIAVVDGDKVASLPLRVAGLMSPDPGEEVARRYTELDAMAKQFGSGLTAPFMTLSFMALLVIPSLKISDKGLFDGERFELID